MYCCANVHIAHSFLNKINLIQFELSTSWKWLSKGVPIVNILFNIHSGPIELMHLFAKVRKVAGLHFG
jgi:hypothetical protein